MPACLACGHSDLRNIGRPPLHPRGSRFTVIECGACGLQWCDPMPTRAELDSHYRQYYERRGDGSTSGMQRLRQVLHTVGWFRRRHEQFQRLIDRHCPKGVLVDYGCGEGVMLAVARDHGWSVVGVEYSGEHAGRLRESGFDVRVATDLASSGIGAGSVDCLVAKHVVEHLVDLERFLADCRAILKPAGMVAIKTPSRTSLRARLGLADWHFVNPPEHQWGFQPHCFRLLLESHGFKVRFLRNDPIVDELACIAGVVAPQARRAPTGDSSPLKEMTT